jgi:hypothetical protein
MNDSWDLDPIKDKFYYFQKFIFVIFLKQKPLNLQIRKTLSLEFQINLLKKYFWDTKIPLFENISQLKWIVSKESFEHQNIYDSF